MYYYYYTETKHNDDGLEKMHPKGYLAGWIAVLHIRTMPNSYSSYTLKKPSSAK